MGIPNGDANAVIAELERKRITHVVVPILHATRESERNLRVVVSERPTQFLEVFANATHDVRRFVARPGQRGDTGPAPIPRPQ